MATVTAVIAYDISDDHRRAHAAATIQVWGDRIQRSVFLARLDPDQLQDLLARLADIIDPHTDSIYCLRQCAACWHDVATIGQATPKPDQPYWSVL